MEDTSAARTANKKKLGIKIAVALACAALAAVVGVWFWLDSRPRNGGPQTPEQNAMATEAPEAEYEIVNAIRYWPEDADFDSCDYACACAVPKFSRSQTAGASMNSAVDEYLEELYARIENEYMPSSVARPPYTEVSCEVVHFGKYTEVVFSESHCYEAQPYAETRVLILDPRGERVNINDVYRTYHSEELLAAAILEELSSSGRGCDGLTATDVMARLDIKSRCLCGEDGITAFFTEGELAPYELGELKVTVNASCLLPDFVGAALTEEEYKGIALFTDNLATACIVRENDVTDGELTPYAATAFMGAAVNNLGYAAQRGRINLSADEFCGIYRNCFGREFPGIDTDGFDIKLGDDGSYAVSSSQKVYEYHFDMFEASRSGDTVTIKGDIVFGAYGYAFTAAVCHATAVLTVNPESPYGFTIIDFKLSL